MLIIDDDKVLRRKLTPPSCTGLISTRGYGGGSKKSQDEIKFIHVIFLLSASILFSAIFFCMGMKAEREENIKRQEAGETGCI